MKVKYYRAYFALLIGSIFFAACTSDDFIIGRDFLDSGVRTVLIDTVSVKMTTVAIDSLKTSGNNLALVGAYNDPYAGRTECKSYISFTLPQKQNFPEHTLVFDSIVLAMVYSGEWLGDTVQYNDYNIHVLTEPVELPENNSFYSNNTATYESDPLTTFSVKPGSLKKDTLSVRLPDSMGSDLFDKLRNYDESVMGNLESFMNYLPGLAVTAGVDNNCVMGFSLSEDSSMVMRIYYHYSTWEKVSEVVSIKPFSSRCFYSVETDRTGTPFENLTKSGLPSSQSDNMALVQALTASFVRIEIPYLNNLLYLGDFSTITSAVLVVYPVKNSYGETSPLPKKLSLFISDENNISQGFVTNYSSQVPQTGNLVVDELYGLDTYYTYDITSFLQDQLGAFGIHKRNLNLIIPSNDLSMTLNTLVAGDYSHPTNRIKLKISYLIYDGK